MYGSRVMASQPVALGGEVTYNPTLQLRQLRSSKCSLAHRGWVEGGQGQQHQGHSRKALLTHLHDDTRGKRRGSHAGAVLKQSMCM